MKTEKTGRKKNELLLLLAAFIWGIAFVAQSEGGDVIGPYTFTCVRAIIAAIVLVPVIRFLDSRGLTGKKPETKEEWRLLILGGISCGTVLYLSSVTQQLGLYLGAGAGKAGFLTACYIVIVPILGLFLRKKCGLNVWIACLMTLAGLYLLCINGAFRLQAADLLVLLCALLCAIHILLIGYFAERVEAVRLTCVQFAAAFCVGFPVMFFTEMGHSLSGIVSWAGNFNCWQAWIPLLYAGVLSSGVAYTFQSLGQIGTNPAVASILMSLESVFSVLAGWILLGEHMGIRELSGCGIIFLAVLLAQISPGELLGKNKN